MGLSPDHPFDPTRQRRAGHPRPIVLLLVGEGRVYLKDKRNRELLGQAEARRRPETVAFINEIRIPLPRSAHCRLEERQIMQGTHGIWVAAWRSADRPVGGPKDLS